MCRVEFRVTFHGPFRVGTGTGGPGVDQKARRLDLDGRVLIAPASTVKGVMRAAAGELLRAVVVDEVFGARGQQSPWSWSGLTVPAESVTVRSRSRIEIDRRTGTVVRDMLAVAEELVIDGPGGFTVRRPSFLPPLDPDTGQYHQAVLRVAAGLITGAGGTRRRGLGWISVAPTADDVEAQVRADLETLGGAA
jgi:hypothetical protein